MVNFKNINKKALIKNYLYCKSFNKEIMVMVKANAYGHGLKNIVKVLKNKVNYWGVANSFEALKLKKLLRKKANVLVVGKTQNFKKLITNNIQITVDSLKELYVIKSLCSKVAKRAKVHIAINSGMNRIGVKNKKLFIKMLNFINKSKEIKLEGIFTHCFDAYKKNTHFYKQIKVFKSYVKYVENKKILIHIGGSFCLIKKLPKFVNMVRVGFFIYGYGNFKLKPVMNITSKIIKIVNCKKNEYIGYGSTKILKEKTIGVVPIGYADGLFFSLSNKAEVTINNQKCKIIGRICMDMFMVDITNKNVKLFDNVIVFNNANYFASLTKTSPYEMLTNFNKLRAKDNIY